MERQEMLKWKKAAWQKLMGAIAMLLVASIMMSATSYAWFVLSTAPEVTDLTTTAGANGALEIALQSNKADGTGRADILSGVGQSIASKDAQTANTYWGNVVDLSEGYGLEHITLYPARLNLNGEVVNTTSMLSIPTFGTDGRVTSLKNAEKTYYKDEKFEQGQSHWGVNVMGATSDKAGAEETITLTYNRDFVLNEARTKVAEYRTSLREQMTKTIEDNSLGIMGYLWRVSEGNYSVDDETETAVRNYIRNMNSIVESGKDAVRWALMASAAADETHFNSESKEDMAALGKLYANCQGLPMASENSAVETVSSVAALYGYTDIAQAAIEMDSAWQAVYAATQEENVVNAAMKLVKISQIYMHGSKGEDAVEGAQSALKYDFEEGVGKDTIYTVNGQNVNLFSAIATTIGDYSGDMSVWMISTVTYAEDGVTPVGVSAKMVDTEPAEEQPSNVVINPMVFTIKATSEGLDNGENAWKLWDEDKNIGVLGSVSEKINGMEAPGTIRVELKRSDLSAYGYSVDLALQCSKNTNLQLQQEAVARVDGDTSGQTMGGGSTMVFDLAGDLTEAQVRKLMQGIYVVLMNTDTGAIYKIAAVDPDQLTVDQLQYPNRATGTLTLYEPVIQNGVLSLGDKAASITAMTADTQLNLTALVFLNGDQVDASMFSGTQALSLTGTLNLQFASSEALTAMDYTDYAPEKTDNP